MSVRSEHIEGAFTEGYWAIQVRLRGDVEGPRYLCHVGNDRQARRLAEGLAKDIEGSRGFSYHRLLAPPAAELPRLGLAIEITDPEQWLQVLERITGYDSLNPRAD